ncbi:MAG: thioredoxin TrxC [Bdellovibrionota bacterium]
MNSDPATFASCPSCYKVNKILLNKTKNSHAVCGHCKSEIPLKDGIGSVKVKQLQALISSSPIPVVVDFWAPWCGPCRSFAPTFEKVASEKMGKAVFVKVNTEEETSASGTFGVRGIPTLAVFKKGSELARESGALPYESFKPWVENFTA